MRRTFVEITVLLLRSCSEPEPAPALPTGPERASGTKEGAGSSTVEADRGIVCNLEYEQEAPRRWLMSAGLDEERRSEAVTKSGAVLLCLILVGCGASRELDPAEQRLLSISHRTPARWSIPSNANVAGLSRFIVLRQGNGKDHVREGGFYMCNLTYVIYDEQGRQRDVFPANLQDFDGFSPRMRGILRGMSAGEVRRAWTTSEDGTKQIIDVEMSSFWIDRGD